MIRSTAAAAGIPQRTFTDAEIVERCIYALVNEGARIVADGSSARASDIDVIYANGYGFPSWRGGPMFYADRVGLAAILPRIQDYERSSGRAGRRRRCWWSSRRPAGRFASSTEPGAECIRSVASAFRLRRGSADPP